MLLKDELILLNLCHLTCITYFVVLILRKLFLQAICFVELVSIDLEEYLRRILTCCIRLSRPRVQDVPILLHCNQTVNNLMKSRYLITS